VPVYHVDIQSMQGQLTLVHSGSTSKRSVAWPENPTNTSFVFSHADLQALRVQYRAPPTTRHSLKVNSAGRQETIHFRLSADGVQTARGLFQIVLADDRPQTGGGPIQDGGGGQEEGHVTEAATTESSGGSRLVATVLTSGLAVTAAIVAVVAVVLIVFRRRRRTKQPLGSPKESDGSKGDLGAEDEVPPLHLPEVILVAVSNLPPIPVATSPPPSSSSAAVDGVVRQPIAVDWSNVDPEILQHCRTTDPILHSEKVWV